MGRAALGVLSLWKEPKTRRREGFRFPSLLRTSHPKTTQLRGLRPPCWRNPPHETETGTSEKTKASDNGFAEKSCYGEIIGKTLVSLVLKRRGVGRSPTGAFGSFLTVEKRTLDSLIRKRAKKPSATGCSELGRTFSTVGKSTTDFYVFIFTTLSIYNASAQSARRRNRGV